MNADWERRFPPRYLPDISLYRPPDEHAVLVEQYNLNGSEPIDIDALMKESQILYETLCKHSEYKTLAARHMPKNRKSEYYTLFDSLFRQAMRNENSVQGQLSRKRRNWLQYVGGSRKDTLLLIREKLLDYISVEYSLKEETQCVVCFDRVHEGDTAFVCENDHMLHFTCACQYALAALLGHRKPSRALCCPIRCGSHLVFKSDQEPEPDVKPFKRVVCVSSRKRKRTVPEPKRRPTKRFTPISNKNARTRRNSRRPKTRSQQARRQKES